MALPSHRIMQPLMVALICALVFPLKASVERPLYNRHQLGFLSGFEPGVFRSPRASVCDPKCGPGRRSQAASHLQDDRRQWIASGPRRSSDTRQCQHQFRRSPDSGRTEPVCGLHHAHTD